MANEMMTNKDARKEMKLVKKNSWDSMVAKLNNNQKQEEKRAEARYETEMRAENREVRHKFRQELIKFAKNKFGDGAIKHKGQLKKLTKDELRALIEGLAEKAKPWAKFQTILIWALIFTWIGIPATIWLLFHDGAIAFFAAFVMIPTHGSSVEYLCDT